MILISQRLRIGTPMPLPEFRRDIFPTPLWVGSVDDSELIESSQQLAYQFRDQPGEKGLVSESWSKGETSADKERQGQKGVTSFYSENLVANSEWDQNLTKLVQASGGMLSDTHGADMLDCMRIANAWVTIYPQGGFVPEHIHSGFWVSGVFYAKAEKDCGEIRFQDPAWVAKSMTIAANNVGPFPGPPAEFKFTPTTGDLLLFPSWLPHSTIKNTSGEDRIIVSFNLIFPGQSQYHSDIAAGLQKRNKENAA